MKPAPTDTAATPIPKPDVPGQDYPARRDVLSFTSDALSNDLWVHGNPIAELAHASHVDVFVRISEVFPAKGAAGRSRNISYGYRRLIDP